MNKKIYFKKELASNWFSLLKEIICYEFQKIEIDFGKKNKTKAFIF